MILCEIEDVYPGAVLLDVDAVLQTVFRLLLLFVML